jgi:adenine-specific DNA-methyltransferase
MALNRLGYGIGYKSGHGMRRYADVNPKKAAGATFTPGALADFVARQICKLAPFPSRGALRICDPAMGEGALLLSLLAELTGKGFTNLTVHGFETNPASLAAAQILLQCHYPQLRLYLRGADFLETADSMETGQFDIIVANPPYVRTQILGAAQAQRLAARFGLSGRVDLAHAFLAAIGAALQDDGVAGVILSNRFLSTRSGTASRQALLKADSLRHIWDLGDTKLFSAAVLPAVLLMHRKAGVETPSSPRFSSIYETTASPDHQAVDALHALDYEGVVAIEDGRRFRVAHGHLDSSPAIPAVWRIKTPLKDAWLARVREHTWGIFGDLGKIRVGIKTCADKVFIRSDWESLPDHEQPEPELLRCLTSHHVARRFKARSAVASRKVLYPHLIRNGQRSAVELSAYPRAAAYLERHRTILSARSYITGTGRQWYELWVPQDPAAWQSPKLVFRDIAQAPVFWIDMDKTIVNGDCYWITGNSDRMDLLWLAVAISNSPFIEEFYDHRFNNKLFAGRRRFMTQYVEHFPLPDPQTASAQELMSIARTLHEDPEQPAAARFVHRIDELTKLSFGVG